MPSSQQPNQSQSSGGKGATKAPNPSTNAERNRVAKEGWGSKYHMMQSYGLKMHDDGDMEEANAILDGYRQIDAQDGKK